MATAQAIKFKTSPKLKPSGIAWLDSIPIDWDLKRLKFLISQPITDGPHETPEFLDDGVPFLSVDGIQDDKLVFENCRNISEENNAQYSLKCEPKKNDILLGKAASVGKVAIVDVDFKFNVWSPLALIRMNRQMLPKYAYYCFKSKSLQEQISILSTSNTQHNLSMDDIPELWFSFPNVETQQVVIDFLDREIGKVDALVDKKQKMIEMLKEKRQALITRAVTKGLDPKAKMKPSGIRWLGDVPENWEIKKLKHLTFYTGSGKTPKGGSEVYLDEGVMLLRSQNVYDDGLRLEDVVFIDELTDSAMLLTRVKPKDILLNITGASIGRCSVVPSDFSRANVNQHVCIIRPNPSAVISSFLHSVMVSQFTKDQINADENGTSREGLNFEQVGNLILMKPPIEEQRTISNFIDRETAKIDAGVNKVEIQIEKLQEYRQALITGAVTGNIKVD